MNFEKLNGLIPAIIQDANTKQVLMLGFMNKEALEKTKETKKVTFFSRTKNRLWTKGEKSGNYLEVVKIISDCDNDSLLILANPKGHTCHTGSYSCFGEEIFTFKKLEKLIRKRKIELPENSRIAKLFQDGLDRIAQKVGEEATEVIIAAKNNDAEDFKNETADLIFHLLVLLAEKNVSINEIIETLEKRHQEK